MSQIVKLDTLPEKVSRMSQSLRDWRLILGVLLTGAVVFFGGPGGYSGMSRAVLHGLCAQTPSHTIMFGDQGLPFDARMTGIYGGFLVTLVSLVTMGRMWRFGNPPIRVMAFLVGLILAMAVDGFNSLLTDLRLWHPYEPTNWMRVITGYGTGMVLAVGLAWLVSSTTWNLSTPDVGADSVRVLAPAAGGLAIFGAALLAHPGWLHLPITIMLVLSAWITVSLLVLVTVLLTLKIDDTVRTYAQLRVPAAMAMLLGVGVMAGLAGSRFWLEHTLGISNVMM